MIQKLTTVLKLTPVENGFALIFDQPTLDRMQVDGDTTLEMTAEKGKLTLLPILDKEKEDCEFESSLEEVCDYYSDVLQKLAK